MLKVLTPTGFQKFDGLKISEKETVIVSDTVCSHNHKFKLGKRFFKANHLDYKTFVRQEVYDLVNVHGGNEYYTDNKISHNCEFLGSSDTLIDGIKLRQMVYREYETNKWQLDIHDKPEKGHVYVICVDTSHGVGQDYSAFTVIDVTTVPYKLVAKFYDNQTSPMMFPEVIAKAGTMYNDAWVLGEINDVGQAVMDALYRDLEYENVITTVSKGRAGQKVNAGFSGQTKTTWGLKMTPQVKRIGCSNLKDLIECDKLITEDFEVLEELSRFVKSKQSYEAEEGYHDDLVMTLVLFGWLVRQQYFRDLTNTDVRRNLAQQRFSDAWDDLTPVGIMNDGSDAIDLESGYGIDPWDNLKL